MVLFRDDRDDIMWGTSWELMRIMCDKVLLQEYEYGAPTGAFREISHIDFRTHCAYLDGKTPMEREHGKLVDFKWEPYHDVYVYEDGYEDRYYIGD